MSGIIPVREAMDIRGVVQLTPLSIGLAAAETAVMGDTVPKEAVYYVWSDEDCYFRVNVGAGGTAASVATSMILLADNPICVVLRQGDVVNAITVTAASGTLRRMLLNRQE